MTRSIQKPRGTQDMIGEQAARFDHVVETFNRVRKLYGFGRVEVPVFEATAVFSRALGETTDVVSKEMYGFEDRGGDPLTLRPEFTAGIARAYIENGWQQHAPVKVAAWGPLFRYERPQKGRFRQFHQLDAEVLGAGEPAADVEVIALAQRLLAELGVADRVVLQLNTLGDAETRSAWRAALVAHFSKHLDVLSAESRERLEKNQLRILDSKAESDKALVADAPRIDAYMTAEAGAFFESVQRGLEASSVAFVRAESLVRGFDYYRHTAFEFVTDALGAQGTVIGGGRYDGLIGSMGGPETPAVGWAGGIERLAMLVAEPEVAPVNVVVIPSSPSTEEPATALLQRLRASGISGIQAYRGNLKRRMELANKTAAPFVIFLNEDGLDKETVIMKDMASGEQKPIRILDIVEVLSLILPPNGSLDEGFTVRVREILALGEAARYPA